MADITPIPSAVQDIGEAVRAIERETGQPSQLIVKVGDVRFLVGDLRTRQGQYGLEMDPQYLPNSVLSSPNYQSFSTIEAAVGIVRSDSHQGPFVRGNPNHGYSIVYNAESEKSSDPIVITIGRITPPLLQAGEKIDIQILK